ncbi:hypothetical protein HT105_24990, partial [Bacteroides fragilis]|nr:hypothetical protein [Bacteroides fragilis]
MGKDVQRAIKNLKAGNYERRGDEVVVDGDIVLGADEYTELVCNAKIAGPRLGKDVQRAIKNLKAGNYERRGD